MTKQQQNIIPFDLGKIPPQAVDIEEAVLGALMLERNAIDKIDLKPEYFYKESHQKIFQAIINLNKKSEPIDLLTVTEELKRLGWIEEVGGPYFITQLTGKVAWAADIERHSCIIIDKYLARELIRFSSDIQERAFDNSEDIQDLIDYTNTELDKINNKSIFDDEIIPIQYALKKSLENLQNREKLFNQGKSIGIPTPVKELTKWTGGWQKSDLIIIAGRPGSGKTAWAIEILRKASQYTYKCCIFSLEMKFTSISDRMLIGNSGINADDFKFGKMNPENWKLVEQSINRLVNLEILIDDKPKSISKIKSRAKNLKRKGKCDLIVIDYLQLMSTDEKSNTNREQEIATISRTAKMIGMELDIPVVLLSQLNREVEKRAIKRPQLSDLRESGAIEQDADIVIFIYRPEYYGLTEDENHQPLNGKSECIISKHRNGRVGTIEFKFNESITEIYDIDDMKDLQFIPNSDQRIEPNKNFDDTLPF